METGVSVEKVQNSIGGQVGHSIAERIVAPPDLGFPFTYVMKDGLQESIINNIRIDGIGVNRPISNTYFRVRMGSELSFIWMYADLLNQLANTGSWGGLLTPTNPVQYQFELPMILTPGTVMTYQTVTGTNSNNMEFWLRGHIISPEEAKRSLTYLKVFDLETENFTSIRFPRDSYVLSMLFFDMLELNDEFSMVKPADNAEYNKLAQYVFEMFVQRGEPKHVLSYGTDRWCNYSVPFTHKKLQFKKPPLLRAESDQLMIKLNHDAVYGVFTPDTGTWKPKVLVEYKVRPGEVGTYV